MIEAKIIKDSVGPSRVRLTTYVLKYPRFIHAEFMTHRMFSRNASSSRAIPVKRMIEEVEKNWAKPLDFHKNKKGMQGGDLLTGKESENAYDTWRRAKDAAVKHAKKLADQGVHKQYVNRLLEPFAHISVVCSATEYSNFFGLRYHSLAQPEIHYLAKQMWFAYMHSTPQELDNGEWHLPFVRDDEVEMEKIEPRGGVYAPLRKSVARCARVSYNNHDGSYSTLANDTQLYERLLGAQPIHASPAEHQAMAVPDENVRSGNFRGWIQYRKTLTDENIISFTEPIE